MLFCFLLCAANCSGSKDNVTADLLLFNGKVLTMEPSRPEVQALAVKGTKILALGSDTELGKYSGKDTRKIDLKGKLAVPGLIDAHGHYMSLGESLLGLELRNVKSWDEIVTMVAAAVKEAEPGDWIVGRGWHQDKWDSIPDPSVEGLPVHNGLSTVSPDNPVLLIHTSGHGVFVNEAVLKQLKITVETPNPPGGEYVRDIQGKPTGMLRESAQDPAREALAAYKNNRPPAEIEAELREHVWLAAEEAIVNGVTTFHDMGETFATIDLLKKMAEEGNLPIRLNVAIEEPSEKLAEKMAAYRLIGHGGGFLTVRMIGEKVLDGALGTHGGWLLEPYSDMPRTSGFNVVPVSDIRHSAALAVQHGFQMAIQGIGDRAVRELLNIYADTIKDHPGSKNFRWRIEHCQVIHPDDLPRFADLGVIASVRGIFATSDGLWVAKRLGEERTRERGYLYQTLFRSGACVINGTDPPVEDIDPIANFYASVTRKMSNGNVFFPEQKMTRQQALETYTINAAYAAFEEDIKGSFSPGKLADITVFSQDIMTVPDEKILATKIAFTIIAGKIKYQY